MHLPPHWARALTPLLLCSMPGLAWAQAAVPTPEKLAKAAAAADRATTTAGDCTVIGNFYWEIGTRDGKLDGKPVVKRASSTLYNADTDVNLASASKWVFGAYVAQLTKDRSLSGDEVAKLHMTSGYTNLNVLSCTAAQKTKGCLPGGKTAAHEKFFYYESGHLQRLALDLGLGDFDKDGLIGEYNHLLGDFGFRFATLNVAGGMSGHATGYARFLQKLLKDELAMGQQLGRDEVCTQAPAGLLAPKPGECQSKFTPSDQPSWGYSHAHWVERNAAGQLQAYSSPGLFGFYPWISANKQHYGVIARESRASEAYNLSAACGRAIRKAFEDELASP